MESRADPETQITTDLPPNQTSAAEDLDVRMCERQQQINLCTLIINDLLHIHTILKERGLDHVSVQELDNA